ncbi:hypothetical protein [Streptomyces sp. NPDC055709]
MNAEEIRTVLDSKVQRINSQRNLTAQAKQTMLARAYVEARDALTQLREQEVTQVQRERQQLERKLFGTTGFNPDPQTVIAKRDAADRAAKYETPAEAEKAMRRAERDGDSILAKAIASRAADFSGEPSWARLVHEYVADKPREAETLQAMQSLPDTDDAVWQLSKAMEYGVLPPDGVDMAMADTIARRPLDGDPAAA